MQELDQWTKTTVIHPLVYGDPEDAPNAPSLEALVADVMKAIRTKVLDSYHNGQGATPGAKLSRPSSFRPRRREFAN